MFYDVRTTNPHKRAVKFPKMYHATKLIQKVLHWFFIAVHNPFSDECTEDFNCCCEVGRFAIVRLNFTQPVSPPKEE